MTAQFVVFAYDAPHHKTHDLLLRLAAAGCRPALVIAAPWINLPQRQASLRLRPRREAPLPPRNVAAGLGVPYLVAPHTVAALNGVLRDVAPDLGCVAGARLLPADLIGLFPRGIVNLHPGLLPESRGLDSWLWDIWFGRPMGVTAHLIDEHVDCGWLISREQITVYADESLPEIADRLHRTQIAMAATAVELAGQLDRTELAYLGRAVGKGKVYGQMDPATLEAIPDRFRTYPWRVADGDRA